MVITVTPSATPVFDATAAAGSQLVVFELALNQVVTASSVTGLVPGQRVIFCIKQPASGAVAFVWPPTVVNPSDLERVASGLTVQEFICRSTGQLYSLGPGMFN